MITVTALAARRAQAQQIFQAAELSRQQGRLSEAESSLRIAITFDPARTEYKEALGKIRIELAGARATKLLAAPSDRMSDAELHEAITQFPTDEKDLKGKIIDTVEKGYYLGEKVIRFAKVVIGA